MNGVLKRNPGLGALLAGQTPSDIADWLGFVAILALLAYVWEAPLIAFALFGIAMCLPYLTFGLLAGALVDRVPVRAVLIWSNLLRGLVFLAMTQATGWIGLVALVALAATIDSAFTPAKQAAIEALVRPDDRMAANGVSYAINQASKIVAPGLGGLLLVAISPEAMFVANGAISVVAAAILLALPKIAKAAGGGGGSLWADATAGLGIVRRAPALRWALGLMAAGFFFMFLYDTLFAPLVRSLGFGARDFGLSLSAVGAGGVLGALLAARVSPERPFRLIGGAHLAGGGLIALAGAAALFAWPPPLALLLAGFAAVGICSALAIVPTRTVIQNAAGPEGVARVTALSEAANQLAILTAPPLGAWLASHTALGWPFALGGGMTVALGLLALWRRPA